MKYLQKLFITSMKEVYSDIVKVELDTRNCYYIYLEDGQIEEHKIPFEWSEVRQILLESICEEDRQKVLDKWHEHIHIDAEAGESFTLSYRAKEPSKDQTTIWRMIHVAVLEEGGRKIAVIFSKEDNEKENRADLSNHVSPKVKAEKDGLTGLYNRIKLDSMLENEYVDMDSCGVMFFNLNDLKKINNSQGRGVGDKAICLAAESVRALQNEKVTAFRYTGDKLLIIARNYTKDEIRQIVDMWVHNWKELCESNEVKCPVSVGMAWDSAPVSALELIAKANAEMHRNKELMKAGIPLDYYVHGEISCSYGLRSRKQFFDMVDYRIESVPGEYCLVAIDIEHFKLFNKWYGRKAGDEFLASFAAALKKYEDYYGGIASYLGGDNFAILMPAQEELLDYMEKDLIEIALKLGDTVGFLPGFGIYYVEDKTLMSIEMYDYAVEALSHVEGNFESRICYYNRGMTSKAEDELRILTEAREALEDGQYVIYLQPKCRIKSKKIVGAEALVRWKHPVKGLVPPGLFIPVLEKNGFISGVDRYVWELVCKQIREWIDNGIEPVPVSINISRIDILSMDVVRIIDDLVQKYDIKRKYLKIEITESAYVENGNKVVEAVQNLRKAGFALMMDDFGSGYSSLNMLKQIAVDVIKIDMKFLDIDQEDMKKGLSILKSVINMSNEIDIPLIVEGVETEEQAHFLGDMGVRFAQGYLFYRPMPAEDFTKLISVEQNVDRRGIFNKAIDTQHLDEVLRGILEHRHSRYNEVDIRKTRGGFISYWAGGNQELISVSKSIIAMYDCETEEEFREYVGNSFIGMVHPDDRYRIDGEINEQIPHTEWKMDYIEYRIITKKGNIRYINDFGHLEEDSETGELFFCVLLLDVTDRLQTM